MVGAWLFSAVVVLVRLRRPYRSHIGRGLFVGGAAAVRGIARGEVGVIDGVVGEGATSIVVVLSLPRCCLREKYSASVDTGVVMLVSEACCCCWFGVVVLLAAAGSSCGHPAQRAFLAERLRVSMMGCSSASLGPRWCRIK